MLLGITTSGQRGILAFALDGFHWIVYATCQDLPVGQAHFYFNVEGFLAHCGQIFSVIHFLDLDPVVRRGT